MRANSSTIASHSGRLVENPAFGAGISSSLRNGSQSRRARSLEILRGSQASGVGLADALPATGHVAGDFDLEKWVDDSGERLVDKP